MKVANELLQHPGLFYNPEVRVGLVQITDEERKAFLGKHYHNDGSLTIFSVPTHRLPHQDVGTISEEYAAATRFKPYAELTAGQVFLAKDNTGETIYYRALTTFNYYTSKGVFEKLSGDGNWLIDNDLAYYACSHKDVLEFNTLPLFRQVEFTFPHQDTTLAHEWVDDPFSGRYDEATRASLCKGDITDYALANGAAYELPEPMGTAVKERIRWLSRQVAILSGETSGVTPNVVLIGQAELNLLLNNLRRQVDAGREVASEILDTVLNNLEKLNK